MFKNNILCSNIILHVLFFNCKFIVFKNKLFIKTEIMYIRKLLSILKSVLIIAFLTLAVNNVFAQSFETLWDRTVSNEETRPDWFSTGDEDEPSWRGTERGIVYSATTEHLYVSSRKEGLPSIHIIDPLTGDDLGTMLTLGIEAGGEIDGGGYRLNHVTTTEGGQIVACNMTLSSGPPTPEGWIKAFRVYKWSYEPVAPEMIIDYEEGGYRLGDKFSVFGDLSGDARIYAVPGESNKVLKWTVTGGIVNEVPEIITLQNVTSAGTSASVAEVSGTDNFYVSGKGFLPTYFTSDGTNLTQVLVSAGPGRLSGRLAEINNELYMAMYQGANNYMNAILIDMTNHGENVGDDDIYGETPSLGVDVTAWGEGAVDLAVIDNVMRVFVCAPDIGIAGYSASDLVVGVEDIEKDVLSLRNYPNPCSFETTIEYSIPVRFNEIVTISVYNINGKLVKEFSDINYINGKNTFVLDTRELPSGIYMYQLNAGNINKTKKITIIK